MSQWLEYSLRDFLMFGPEVYWRLFELHNQGLWPLPVVAIVVNIAFLLGHLLGRRLMRATCVALALTWAGSAHFLATRYAPINWPMEYVAWLFVAEAAAFVVLAMAGMQNGVTRLPRLIGTGLIAWSVLLHPFLTLPFERPLAQAEVVGLAPDPTAIATLGFLLLLKSTPWRWTLSVVPLAWCSVSAVTLLTLGDPQWLVLVGTLSLWLVGLVRERMEDRRGI